MLLRIVLFSILFCHLANAEGFWRGIAQSTAAGAGAGAAWALVQSVMPYGYGYYGYGPVLSIPHYPGPYGCAMADMDCLGNPMGNYGPLPVYRPVVAPVIYGTPPIFTPQQGDCCGNHRRRDDRGDRDYQREPYDPNQDYEGNRSRRRSEDYGRNQDYRRESRDYEDQSGRQSRDQGKGWPRASTNNQPPPETPDQRESELPRRDSYGFATRPAETPTTQTPGSAMLTIKNMASTDSHKTISIPLSQKTLVPCKGTNITDCSISVPLDPLFAKQVQDGLILNVCSPKGCRDVKVRPISRSSNGSITVEVDDKYFK